MEPPVVQLAESIDLLPSSSKSLGTKRFGEAVATIQKLTADDLEHVSAAILDQMSSQVAMIPELAGHLLNAGGKRLRPMLTLSAAGLLGYEGHEHIKLAAAVELIHGATLLHDDVVDESNLRRGEKTANVVWGNKESVLVGDFVFSRAFELMVSAGDLKVLQILSHASGVIAEGEVMQLSTQHNLNSTIEMYLAVVKAKTAALFAAAAQAGAVIAKADGLAEQSLHDFGHDLGIAFQLVDDALDYDGHEEAMGKSIGDDFREGKMTLPIVYSMERATPKEKKFWQRVISDGHQVDDDLQQAISIMQNNDSLKDTLACAEKFSLKAQRDLENIPENPYSIALKSLAAQSVNRVS